MTDNQTSDNKVTGANTQTGLQYKAMREVRTYADLFNGARVLRDRSRVEKVGSYYVIMSAILLLAFTFEAFLNRLGEKAVEDWKKEHDRKSAHDKLDLLAQTVNLHVDKSRRPIQTIKRLFSFATRLPTGAVTYWK